MNIELKVNQHISLQQFTDVLKSSALGDSDLVNDEEFIQGILDNSNLVVSAWDNEKLVGVARSITDFHCACYLSELAIDKDYQKLGLGKKLQQLTKQQLGPKCKLLLIATDGSNEYYERIGFKNNPRCWVLEGNTPLANS